MTEPTLQGGGDDSDQTRRPLVQPSLRRNSVASFLQQSLGLGLSLGASVITARALGPAGKGVLATLSLLVLFGSHIGGAGFGEAAIVEAATGRTTLQHILRATIAAVGATSLVASAALLLVGLAVFHSNLSTTLSGLLIAVPCLVFGVYFAALSQFLNVSERVVLTSTLSAITSIVTLALTVAFVIVLSLKVAGAMLAVTVSSLVGMCGTLLALHLSGLRLGLRWDGDYVRRALRFGSIVQTAYLVGALAGRADLLMVYVLESKAAAGFYSVALTIGAITGYPAWAVSYASFPRLATVGPATARDLTVRACRLGIAAAVFCAAGLMLITPVVLPAAFGTAYRPAVSPALIVIPGGVIVSGQVLLCRALAARGDPRPLLVSFAVSLGAMVLGDLIAIPALGITGAAGVSTASACVGLWAAVRMTRRRGLSGLSLAELCPRLDDFRAVLALAVSLAGIDRAMSAVRAR